MLGQREKYTGVMRQSNHFSQMSCGDGYPTYHENHEMRPALLIGIRKA